jgi:hypothetical protein
VAEKREKKVVRVESTAKAETAAAEESDWKPSPENKSKALTSRIIAAVLWLLALGGEAFAIFYLLKQNPVNLVFLIIAIVVIGLLAIGGSLLWKRANRFDPARKADTVRFFVQNQLGVIISILAFLPLIILIFTNKNMDGKQKGIAGAIAIVVLIVAGLFGVSWNPPSVEQYDSETQTVIALTGQDLVFWTKEGKVYHLCEEASAVNLESADNTIYSGTVADAHGAGKERLTLQVEQEMDQCGYEMPADVDGGIGDTPSDDSSEETPAP